MRRAALASPSPVRCARCVKLVSRGGLLVPAAHTWIEVLSAHEGYTYLKDHQKRRGQEMHFVVVLFKTSLGAAYGLFC